MNKVIMFPNYIAQMGGASTVIIKGNLASVTLEGQIIKVPFAAIKDCLDCGFKVANIAAAAAV